MVNDLTRDAHGHGDSPVVRTDHCLPAVVHVSVRGYGGPESVALVIERDDSGFAFLLVVLADGVDVTFSILVFERNHNIGVSQISSLVRTEQLVAVLQADQALAPEELVNAVTVEVQNGAEVACTCSAVIERNQDVPALFQLAVFDMMALKIHVTVSSLGTHQNRDIVGISARDVEAV